MSRFRPPEPLQFGALTLLYFALARFGMALFALQPSNITLLWLPAGVALVACLHWGWRAVPFVVLASFAANYAGMAGRPAAWLHTGVAALADGMAGIVAARLARRFLPDGLQRAQDLLPFGLWVCLLPTTLSGWLLSLNLALGGYIEWRAVGEFVRMLVLADSLGLVLVYQVYEGWRARRSHAAPEWHRLAMGTALLAALLAVSAVQLKGLLFFVLPVLVMLSFGVSLVALAPLSSVTMVCVIAATARGLGPFVESRPEESRLELMAFAFASALTVLGVALQNRQLIASERFGRQWRDAAEHDELTGLMNRRAFLPRLHVEHQRALRTGRGYTVAMLDLDRFKAVNDGFGHACGDQVLIGFTAVMLESCRAIDAVARLGGEEFAMLLPESDAEAALVALERVRAGLEARCFVCADGQPIRVTVSIGVAALSDPLESEASLLQRADRALYAAKEAGRNRILVDSSRAASIV